MNKIIKYIGASAVVCMMAGCTTNFEDFNTNPYQPSKVPASNLLSTMFNVYAVRNRMLVRRLIVCGPALAVK